MIKSSINPPNDSELPKNFHGTQGMFGVRISRDGSQYAIREGNIMISDVPTDRRIHVGNNVIVVGTDGTLSLEGDVSMKDLTPGDDGVVRVTEITGTLTMD